jgi:Tfp pilus assembly pilus retraction ATPase PilT
MNLEPLIAAAKQQGASDLHLESGLPAALRIRGALRTFGEPVPSQTLLGFAREILGEEQWSQFVERRSADFYNNI